MEPLVPALNATVFHVIFISLALLMGTIHCIWRRNTVGFSKSECFLVYFLILTVGIQSLLVGYFEIFYPEFVIEYVGWPPSPFLSELGMAHIAFGILGVFSYWFKNGWRTAAGVGYSSYLLMAAFTHIRSIYFTHQYELGNIGPTLFSDIVVPLCIITLLILRKV